MIYVIHVSTKLILKSVNGEADFMSYMYLRNMIDLLWIYQVWNKHAWFMLYMYLQELVLKSVNGETCFMSYMYLQNICMLNLIVIY